METAWIPSPANPYQEPNAVRPYEPPEPSVVTLRDVDRLVAAKLEDARVEAAGERRRACLSAWEEGKRDGYQEGMRAGHEIRQGQVGQVIGGVLIHVARHLEDRTSRPKTTIADERAFMAAQAKDLRGAIARLENGAG